MQKPDVLSHQPSPKAIPKAIPKATDDLCSDTPDNVPEAMTPEQLSLKASNDSLFEREMMPHIQSLYHFAYRLTSDEDDANDLVQDTFLKAYRFIKSYEQGSNAKAWLFRILKNSFINNYRKTSKEPGKVDYEEAEAYLQTGKAAYSDTLDGSEKIFRALVGDEVTFALNSLPVDFRTVIILCDIEEFTYEEIAKIVDIPIGTVRSRLHRARKMLRDLLTGYALSMGYNVLTEPEIELATEQD